MVKIDLVTGFLGSGKTTFLKKYAKRLMEQGQNIGILENDFGAVNVDMMLLQELEGEHCELEMVSSGSSCKVSKNSSISKTPDGSTRIRS
jgi:G3E family GTPase